MATCNQRGEGMVLVPKEEKRRAWESAIALNQLDGEWIPSDEYMELVEKEINGEITTQEMINILNKKYLEKH